MNTNDFLKEICFNFLKSRNDPPLQVGTIFENETLIENIRECARKYYSTLNLNNIENLYQDFLKVNKDTYFFHFSFDIFPSKIPDLLITYLTYNVIWILKECNTENIYAFQFEDFYANYEKNHKTLNVDEIQDIIDRVAIVKYLLPAFGHSNTEKN